MLELVEELTDTDVQYFFGSSEWYFIDYSMYLMNILMTLYETKLMC